MYEKLHAQKRVSVIAEVKELEKDYSITDDKHWGLFLSKSHGVTPKVGDSVAIYGLPFAHIQGVDINGKEVFFKTQAEMDKERLVYRKDLFERQMEDHVATVEKIKNDERFEAVDISGMGGSYEWGCQAMLRAGRKFLKEHPDFHFDYRQYKGVTGICLTDTPWGKDLDKVLSESVNNESTGAMHQYVVNHLALIHKHGYDWWLKHFPKRRRYMYPVGLPAPKRDVGLPEPKPRRRMRK